MIVVGNLDDRTSRRDRGRPLGWRVCFTDHGTLKFRETAQAPTQYRNNSSYCIIFYYCIFKTGMIRRKVTKAKARNSADESNDSPLGFEPTLWAAACNPSFAVLGRFGDKRWRRLFAAGVVFALFDGAMAGPLEDGRAAYQRGDYGVAMRLLRSPAPTASPKPKGIWDSCMRRVRA